MYFEFKDSKEFTDFIRQSAIDILAWNFETYGQVNNTKIGIYIKEDINEEEYWDWSFIIDCKKVREFKTYIKMDFEEFDSVLKSHRREEKIKDIINDTEADF